MPASSAGGDEALQQLVRAAIQDDWATLSRDPELVVRRVAEQLTPVLLSQSDDEIKGQPWSAR